MKKYGYLIGGVIFLALILGIIFFERAGNYFKATPEEVHQRSLNTAIFYDSTAIADAKELVLIVALDVNAVEELKLMEGVVIQYIEPSHLLDRENKRLFKNHAGIIVLKSNSAYTAANSWVLLNRMGYQNIKIWEESEGEIVKYSFQPDSLAGLK